MAQYVDMSQLGSSLPTFPKSKKGGSIGPMSSSVGGQKSGMFQLGKFLGDPKAGLSGLGQKFAQPFTDFKEGFAAAKGAGDLAGLAGAGAGNAAAGASAATGAAEAAGAAGAGAGAAGAAGLTW